MSFQPRIIEGGGSLLLPRESGSTQASWPLCLVCKRTVDAYGLGEQTPKYIELWARCDGIGGIYGGKHARSYRAGIRIDLTRYPGGLTQNVLVDILRRLALRPDKFAKWSLEMRNADMVRPA